MNHRALARDTRQPVVRKGRSQKFYFFSQPKAVNVRKACFFVIPPIQKTRVTAAARATWRACGSRFWPPSCSALWPTPASSASPPRASAPSAPRAPRRSRRALRARFGLPMLSVGGETFSSAALRPVVRGRARPRRRCTRRRVRRGGRCPAAGAAWSSTPLRKLSTLRFTRRPRSARRVLGHGNNAGVQGGAAGKSNANAPQARRLEVQSSARARSAHSHPAPQVQAQINTIKFADQLNGAAPWPKHRRVCWSRLPNLCFFFVPKVTR